MTITRFTRALLVLTLLACLPLAARPTVAASPIYIGQLVPLTGAYAPAGLNEQAGAKLALAQINAQGGINGRPLQILQADDQSTPDGAIAAFKQLTQTGRISAFIGPVASVQLQAMSPSIKQAGLPVIIGGGAAILTHEGNPWVFRTRSSGTYSAKTLAVFAVNTLHLKRIAIIHATDPSSVGQEAALRADLAALGLTPVTDQAIPTKATDLTAQVQAIKQSGATALISLSAFPADYLLLGRTVRQAGLHLTWLGDPVLSSPFVVGHGGALFYGTYVVVDYMPGQSPQAAAFDRALQARSHLPGTYIAAYVYDGLQILAMVMRKVGTDPQAIRQGILAIQGYHGAMGTYNFDRHGDGLRQENIVQNVQGEMHLVKTITF